MKIWQGLPLGLGTKRPSRIWVEDKSTHTCMHIPTCTCLLCGSQGCVEGQTGLFNVSFSLYYHIWYSCALYIVCISLWSPGGIVLNPSFYGTFGHTDTMVHEIGHSLGLYHVFRGISEVESCNDACLETEPSMETGDLCADTNPTPKYKGCHDPHPGNETCGCRDFTHTPFNNYMSYAGEPINRKFTPSLEYPDSTLIASVTCR